MAAYAFYQVREEPDIEDLGAAGDLSLFSGQKVEELSGYYKDMRMIKLAPEYDPELADLIRFNLKKYQLDIPGTVYFDDNLNHLSDYYLAEPEKRFYFIVTDDSGKVIGGIGLAEFEFFEECCELQKLYLADEVKGAGLSYKLITMIEDKARELGYKQMYLETHDNLAAAIHVYEKSGFNEIDKPAGVVHATMNRFFIKGL